MQTCQCVSIPQCVGGNGHYAFRALFGGKARGILQSFIRQRGQMEARLVRVTEPGATGHCQHLLVRNRIVCLDSLLSLVSRLNKEEFL